MKRIAVLTSGGDAPGMNACIRAVVRKAISMGVEVIGVRKGFSGLISGDFMEMTSRSVGGIMQSGGTILQTARCEEFKTQEGRTRAMLQLKTFQIDGLIGIGGSGTFTGLSKFVSTGANVVGIPATIDNDIGFTDYAIGFDTACNTVLNAINNIRDTATSHDRTYVIEVMGRDSGHIALAAGLTGGAESILIPEFEVDLDEVCEKITAGVRRGKKHSIVIVAEGINRFLDPKHLALDGNAAYHVGKVIREKTGLETRITVLGHIQRGGAPTLRDRMLAILLGVRAVEELLSGNNSVMVGVCGNDICVNTLDKSCETKNPIKPEYYSIAKMLSSL